MFNNRTDGITVEIAWGTVLTGVVVYTYVTGLCTNQLNTRDRDVGSWPLLGEGESLCTHGDHWVPGRKFRFEMNCT